MAAAQVFLIRLREHLFRNAVFRLFERLDGFHIRIALHDHLGIDLNAGRGARGKARAEGGGELGHALVEEGGGVLREGNNAFGERAVEHPVAA